MPLWSRSFAEGNSDKNGFSSLLIFFLNVYLILLISTFD